MKNVPLKLYRLKFYLNARHYIIINGKKGDIHPHTWEFTLYISVTMDDFKEFSMFEKGIADYLAKYQNQIINDFSPFTSVIPTIENITDYFAEDFSKIISETGGFLDKVEASETPTRTYILEADSINNNNNIIDMFKEKAKSDVAKRFIADIK